MKRKRRNYTVTKRGSHLSWKEPGPTKDPLTLGAPWADAYLRGAYDGDLCPACGIHATEGGGLCAGCCEEAL